MENIKLKIDKSGQSGQRFIQELNNYREDADDAIKKGQNLISNQKNRKGREDYLDCCAAVRDAVNRIQNKINTIAGGDTMSVALELDSIYIKPYEVQQEMMYENYNNYKNWGL